MLIPTVSPGGYAMALGLTPLATKGMYNFFRSNKVNEVASVLFSGICGYLFSVGAANLVGCNVSVIGPFMGMISLAGSALVISLVAVPTIIAGTALYFYISGGR